MTATTTRKPAHDAILDWVRDRGTGAMPEGAALFHAPSTAFQSPGGGEIQLARTGQALERLGWTIRLFSPWIDRIDQARLLHLFGMSREGLALARVARARKVPVVVSPISWFEPVALRALAAGPVASLKASLAYAARRACPAIPSWRRELLALSDRILPNSESEARQLLRLFAVPREKIVVVPNAVDDRFAWASAVRFRDAHGLRDFVLYTGRIEPRKNVLGLVRAIAGTGLPLVLIGDPVPGHETYAETCRARGRGFAHWLPAIPHDDPLLASAYAAARVFALPSWFETPGLAALEAAAAGCGVVITPYGSTRDYFGDRVEYARPDRPHAIQAAVVRAWEQGPQPDLASTVKNRYHWAHVARKTAEAYHSLER
jgi:glycosyltransferase involved in cell wall biosynthesis